MYLLQSPHNTVTYSIIGDATAQTLFNINTASGLITTRQSLLNNNVEKSSVSVVSPKFRAHQMSHGRNLIPFCLSRLATKGGNISNLGPPMVLSVHL